MGDLVRLSDHRKPRKSREQRITTALFRLKVAEMLGDPAIRLRFSCEFYAALFEGMPEGCQRPSDTEEP